ncbi:MAG TPA: ABC transporter ATP-binding protein [Candidatus Hydrogenedentes bacterium]|nr:ABC transporter ATP-binding protein [Candidatus Hydrogenedentota bacterium]
MSEGYHTEDEVQQRAYDRQLMRRLLGYLRAYRPAMATAVALLLGASILANLAPYLNKVVLDNYIGNPERIAHQEQAAGAADAPALEALIAHDRRGLGAMIFVIACLMVGETLARYLQNVIVAYVGQKTMLTMRLQIFEHLQRMSLRFLDRNPIGRLMTRVTNDVEKIQETIVAGMVQVVSDLLTVFVILAFMLWVNWQLALIIMTTVPFVFVTGFVFRRYARRSYIEIRKRLARMNAYAQEMVGGMRIVQMFTAEEPTYEEYRQRNQDHRDEWFRQVRNYAIYFPVVDFLGMLAIGLIVLYIGDRFLRFGDAVGASVGTLFAYIQWSERFYSPIRTIADRYNLLLEAMASSERIFELLDTEEDIQNAPDAIVPDRFAGRVEFNDVWFAYEPGQWVLKGINLSIAPGERIAIVGHTGAGKTTIINLLSRYYDVQRGRISIDGVDVRQYEKTALRRRIGTVLQDVFLFSGSIEQNIRLGNEDLTMERVHECAAYVNAARFIEKMPGGYAYDVGERGNNLSTGQRQLLAFARTLAHEPQILVLDEATSSVDTETEALIQDAIRKLMQGGTSIVIAHRLSTVQNADRIVVMHHGEIRETGTHRELLEQRGLYYRLYQLQYKNPFDASEVRRSS